MGDAAIVHQIKENNMKRFITIALSLCLMVSTAACGNKGSSESTGETTAFDTTDTAAQTAAPEKTQTTTTTAPPPLMPPMAKASEYLNFEIDVLINSISTTFDNKLVLECTPEELVVYGEEAPMNIYVYDPVDERVVSSFALANAGAPIEDSELIFVILHGVKLPKYPSF